MALAEEWQGVEEALARLTTHAVLIPTVTAMRRVVDRLGADPAFGEVRPSLSHATLVLAVPGASRRVMVGWHEDSTYHVAFLGPLMEISESTLAGEDAVLDVLRTYLELL